MFEIKLETRVTALKKILKKLMCSLFHLLRFNEKKRTENLWNMKLSKFSIRGHAYEKLDYIAPLQHLFLDVDLGDKHLHSLTLSVRDGNGELFHFNGFPLEFDLKID